MKKQGEREYISIILRETKQLDPNILSKSGSMEILLHGQVRDFSKYLFGYKVLMPLNSERDLKFSVSKVMFPPF